ncbi:MAG TPA: hypothetical protein ACFYED_03150 [Candidatus Tripitaka californicus]|uniref:hypothetical protein n=1 Tax=Candidatus Tripitaka californicus TaxID=3367616 RepID=UPI00402913EE|nr:hypothetical protein [Planctomycetota bacterium]
MKRTIDIIKNPEKLNLWVRKSIELFKETAYLDNIQEVYPFESALPLRKEDEIRREIIQAHHNRNTERLLDVLIAQAKFPYEDPIWYLVKEVKDCARKNPQQIKRIAGILYSMTAEEALARLESPPKLNQQTGPMFGAWLRKNFESLAIEQFKSSDHGTFILEASEEEGKKFVGQVLKQDLEKRPDLVAKVNSQYIIGEAKWIGQPGGNQGKQVSEVLKFCGNQRGNVRRIGIVDGFPWALYKRNGRLINSKEAILVQESPYDILSALLLRDYFCRFLS